LFGPSTLYYLTYCCFVNSYVLIKIGVAIRIIQKSPMVSSPVADLLTPRFQDTYKEYKNDAGDTLTIKTFIKDDVKMVSVNGIEVEIGEFMELIEEVFDDSEYKASVIMLGTIILLLFVYILFMAKL